MPSIKIYPPTPLPDRGVSETSFNIWIEELEVYLGQEKEFEVFLKDGAYEKWESYETNPNRIPALKNEAVAGAGAEERAEVQTQNEEKLKETTWALFYLHICFFKEIYKTIHFLF